MTKAYFSQASFKFLTELAGNNNRTWFEANKPRYEQCVRMPALEFICDMADELKVISPHFRAIPKKVGGSLMRVYKDVRFSKDKTPYKINVGIHFRHELAKDVHAPGWYLHIEPGGCFVGAGIWRPDSKSLAKIREFISDNGNTWRKITHDKAFKKRFEMSGEKLTNAPRGYAKDHPLVEDLKRKDFIVIAPLADSRMRSAKLIDYIIQDYRSAAPYMKYLCHALDLQF